MDLNLSSDDVVVIDVEVVDNLHDATHEEDSDQEHCLQLNQDCTDIEADFNISEKRYDLDSKTDDCKTKKHYECNECSYMTPWKSHFADHKGKNNPNHNFTCSVCYTQFTCLFLYEKHMKVHTKKKYIMCKYCSFKCQNSFVFKLHRAKHSILDCSLCSYTTNTKTNINNHYITEHPNYKRFSCSLCSYKTRFRSNLNNHNLVHTGIRKFECSYCTYAAATGYTLQRHIKKHTGEKAFKCPHCSYTASRKDNYNNHLRLHGKKEPLAFARCSTEGADILSSQ